MKRIFAAMIILASAAMSPVFAAGTGALRASVPFDFVVSGKTLPAGEYDVALSFTEDTMFVRSTDRKTSAIVMTQPTVYSYALNTNNDATLGFEVINGKHYLASAARPGVSKHVNRPKGSGGGVLAYVKAVLR